MKRNKGTPIRPRVKPANANTTDCRLKWAITSGVSLYVFSTQWQRMTVKAANALMASSH